MLLYYSRVLVSLQLNNITLDKQKISSMKKKCNINLQYSRNLYIGKFYFTFFILSSSIAISRMYFFKMTEIYQMPK